MAKRMIQLVERTAGDVRLRGDRTMTEGTSLTVGRDGDLVLGMDPLDGRVSRLALVVKAACRGWTIDPRNRNGVDLHYWGLMPHRMRRREQEEARAPRVALRVVGSDSREHWVLLRDDETRAHEERTDTTASTEVNDSPRPLTDREEEALRGVFRDYLAWPPVLQPVHVPLSRVARKIQVTGSAIRERLHSARCKAQALGPPLTSSVTRPDYLHALIRSGYLDFSVEHLDPALHPTSGESSV